MAKPNYFIGTSGWNYEAFIGTIYDEKTPKRRYLETYATYFNSVELNASFYRSFAEKTWQGWYERTPSGFVWSVKAPRLITHIRRLEVEKDSVDMFFDRAFVLREKLGAVLFQLPPSLKYDGKVFDGFVSTIPQGVRVAFEARNETWFVEDVFKKLQDRNIAWVVSDTCGRYPMKKIVTADFAYVRLHGTMGLYRGPYGRDGLIPWVQLLRSWKRDCFVYFDNTDDGSAASDALIFKELIKNEIH